MRFATSRVFNALGSHVDMQSHAQCLGESSSYAGSTSHPRAPRLGTIAEALRGYEVSTCFDLVAPARTPDTIVNRRAAIVLSGAITPEPEWAEFPEWMWSEFLEPAMVETPRLQVKND